MPKIFTVLFTCVAHHLAADVDVAISSMAREDFAFCWNTDRLANQLLQRLSSWSSHVTSWVDAPGVRVHVVRYEDMANAAVETFTSAKEFAGLPLESERIAKAIEFSKIQELQRQESESGFREKSPRAESFFRRGEVGAWREMLTEKQASRIIEAHEEIMKRFGYLTRDGEPVF